MNPYRKRNYGHAPSLERSRIYALQTGGTSATLETDLYPGCSSKF